MTDEEFADYWSYLVEKMQTSTYNGLSKDERVFYSANILRGSVPRSGVVGYFENTECDVIRDAHHALSTLGLTNALKLLQDAQRIILEGDPLRPFIVVCHELGASKASVVDLGILLQKEGFNVLLFDFRGHGGSEGDVSGLGGQEKRDVLGAIDFLQKGRGVEARHIGLYGVGMGAHAAVLAAVERPALRVLVLDGLYPDPVFALTGAAYVPPPMYDAPPLTLGGALATIWLIPPPQPARIAPAAAPRIRRVMFAIGRLSFARPFAGRETARRGRPYTDSRGLCANFILPSASHQSRYRWWAFSRSLRGRLK